MIHPLYHFYKNCMNGQLEIIFWKILSFFLDGTELYARPDTLSYILKYLSIKVHKYAQLSMKVNLNTYYAPCPAEGRAPPKAVNGRGRAGWSYFLCTFPPHI